MLPSHHWARSFTVEADDIDYLVNLLLEKEIPLSSYELASILVEKRLQDETAKLEERYKDARIYDPAQSYKVGQKVVFQTMNYATARVSEIREGENADYGDFKVATVEFEDEKLPPREFACDLTLPHKLNQPEEVVGSVFSTDNFSAEQIMEQFGSQIIETVENKLRSQGQLVSLARKWFPRDLMLEPDDGHLNLAEAVLDINGGGPMHTADILEQIGGLGSSSQELQVFSMNYVMNQDRRFDEVGPTGEILWYLQRMEPEDVLKTPAILQYNPIDYDRALLTPEMMELEQEIADELSDLQTTITSTTEGTVTLIYPHRRAGTLPLNIHTRHIFPTAQRTTRVYITLVDGQDDEEYIGWVVPGEKYVYGLGHLYRKYSLPIGSYVTISKTDTPGKIRIDFSAYRARTEWIRLITAKGEQIQFDNDKRSIGADYDDLMILGIDDLESLDETVKTIQKQRRTLAAIMRMIIPNLGRLTPQGTAHAKTIYSAVNVIRRCPPGPILAILEANPDFENVGGHYWKLSDE